MPGLRLIAIAALTLAPLPVLGGDASGFDPQAIDQCLGTATTAGTRADCAGAGRESCLAFVAAEHPDLTPEKRRFGCLDAEWQAWEAKLQSVYDALKARESERGNEAPEALAAMERSWVAFRDNLCAYDRLRGEAGADGEGGDGAGEDGAGADGAGADDDRRATAALTCKIDEAARQTALLLSYRDDGEAGAATTDDAATDDAATEDAVTGEAVPAEQ